MKNLLIFYLTHLFENEKKTTAASAGLFKKFLKLNSMVNRESNLHLVAVSCKSFLIGTSAEYIQDDKFDDNDYITDRSEVAAYNILERNKVKATMVMAVINNTLLSVSDHIQHYSNMKQPNEQNYQHDWVNDVLNKTKH